MAQKLSDKLKGLFKRADTYLGKAIDKVPKSKTAMMKSIASESLFKKGTVNKLSSKLPSAAKFASATKKAGKFGKLKTIGRIASRAALPVAAGVETVSLAYKLATRTPEQKAKTRALKSKLSKTSTKDYHADLMKMSTGGDTMLQNPKKADLDKDGKLSGYEKKRAKAIESNMKQKPIKAVLGIATMGLLGAKMLSDKKKKKAIKAVSPVAMLADVTKEEKNQVTTGQQKARKGKMMKAYKGDMADSKKSSQERSKLMVKLKKKISGAAISESEAEKLMNMSTPEIKSKIKNMYKGGESKGYGAARTQGEGLQDENLIPGKSLDYYKDIM